MGGGMDELNPNDFLFGYVSDIKHTICNEYTSNVKLTKKQQNRIRKIAEYRFRFFDLTCDIRNTDYGMRDYFHSTINNLSNDDFSNFMHPLTFNFNCCLYHDLEETAQELDKFKQFVVSFMKLLKKEAGGEAMVNGIIRDSAGRDITDKALEVMEKALIVANDKLWGMPNAAIVDDIIDGKRTPEQKMKARDDIARHRKNAAILVERVKSGTFPYDENGEWKLE